jgi:hypothetical protein
MMDQEETEQHVGPLADARLEPLTDMPEPVQGMSVRLASYMSPLQGYARALWSKFMAQTARTLTVGGQGYIRVILVLALISVM